MTNQLNQTQIEQYHRDGFLVLEEFLSPTWLERLRQTTEAFVEESRKVERSDKVFDVEPDHTNDNPRSSRRRRSKVASGHSILASHQLRLDHHRRLFGRCS